MHVTIARERPDARAALELIGELERDVGSQYPRESRHGLSPEQLLRENVAFFVLRVEGEPAGCGGVKLCNGYAELKRLFVRPEYRGQGLARQMLRLLESYALGQGSTMMRLETGIYQIEAMGLYESCGYREIPPFGPFTENPMNRFFEKLLQ